MSMIGDFMLYDHLMNTKIFTLITNKTFIQAMKSMRQIAMSMLCICQSSHNNYMFHIPREVGVERNVSM
jgi:hypothetical protein